MTARHFIERLGAFQLPQLGPRETSGPFQVHWLDLRRLKLGLGAFTPFITLDVPRDSVDLRQALLAFSREVAGDSPTVYLAEQDDDYGWVDRRCWCSTRSPS